MRLNSDGVHGRDRRFEKGYGRGKPYESFPASAIPRAVVCATIGGNVGSYKRSIGRKGKEREREDKKGNPTGPGSAGAIKNRTKSKARRRDVKAAVSGRWYRP